MPVSRGDKKGGIESQHHSDHKRLDHKLPGSSGGKLPERGEDHPAIAALFNSIEYRREYLHYVISHNKQLTPHLAPLEMTLRNPEIELTRINIFHWLRQRHSAEAPINIEVLRAQGMPDIEAVIRKNGIYPLIKIQGMPMIIPNLRYSSPELVATGLLAFVKRSGKTMPTRLKIDAANPMSAFLPTKAGLLSVSCVSRRESLRDKLTMADWISLHEERRLKRDRGAGDREQREADTFFRRQTVTQNAKAEQAAEVKAAGKRPSKTATVKNLERNLKRGASIGICSSSLQP